MPRDLIEDQPAPKRAARRTPEMDARHCRFALRVGRSPIHRWGVFAEEPIPAARRVVEYVGERITDDEAAEQEREHVYLFDIGGGMMIDGAVGGSGAQYINHSCEPNLIARLQRGHIWYSSLRPIEPGEELTVDYRLDADEVFPCGCGAEACRGFMNAPEEEAAE